MTSGNRPEAGGAPGRAGPPKAPPAGYQRVVGSGRSGPRERARVRAPTANLVAGAARPGSGGRVAVAVGAAAALGLPVTGVRPAVSWLVAVHPVRQPASRTARTVRRIRRLYGPSRSARRAANPIAGRSGYLAR